MSDMMNKISKPKRPPVWNKAYPFEDLYEFTTYHVVVKIAEGHQTLFPRTSDAYYYIRKLRDNLIKYHCHLAEYMTMSNHFHFLAVSPDGLEPLMKAIKATNVSYSMHLRFLARHCGKSERNMEILDCLRENSSMKVFQDTVSYIPISGNRQLLVEMRYIKRNPENANLLDGDRHISSRKEYIRNHFTFTDKETIESIAERYGKTPMELHNALMIDDMAWGRILESLLPTDLSDEFGIFKTQDAKFSLTTFRFPPANSPTADPDSS